MYEVTPTPSMENWQNFLLAKKRYRSPILIKMIKIINELLMGYPFFLEGGGE